MAITLSNQGLSDTLVILGAAGLVIPAFARFRISPVIGFILVGMLVGPSGLGSLVTSQPWLYHVTISNPHAIEPFAEFGIILLLFAIGLELSFKRIWSLRRLVFGTGAAELGGSALLIGAGLIVLGQDWQGSLGLGLALALSSTALVLPLAGTTSPVGRAAFAMLLFEDLALVPIIFLLSAIGPAGGNGLAGVGFVALMGALTIAALYVGGRFILPRLFAQAARTKSPEVFLAASLLVAIVASVATSAAGLSPIVGALLAGLLIAETDYHHEVETITAPFRGLALGVFLITVGMGVDPRALWASGPSLLLAVVGVVAVKTVVTFLLLRIANARPGVAAETGLLMGSPSETTLIVLGTATAAGLISQPTAAFWQAVTAIGLTLTPLLARLGSVAARRIERSGKDKAEPAIPDTGPGAVIIGFGRVGRIVADMLSAHDISYLAVEADVDAVAAARRDKYPVVFGDPARRGMSEKLRLAQARALILTMDDPVLTVRLTRQMRALAPDLPIIARARDPRHAAELYRAGVTDAVPETLESSLQLSEAVLVDMGMAVGPVIASIHQKRDDLRQAIRREARLDREPRIRRIRLRSQAPSSSPSTASE